jgi:predicted RNase H-like HicB family nuclease
MEQVAITAKLLGMTRFDEETKSYVGLCPRFKVYSQGATEEEARTALRESVQQYIEVCLAHKTFEDVLTKAGFSKITHEARVGMLGEFCEYVTVERTLYEQSFEMEIPLNLIAAEAFNRAGNSTSPLCI